MEMLPFVYGKEIIEISAKNVEIQDSVFKFKGRIF